VDGGGAGIAADCRVGQVGYSPRRFADVLCVAFLRRYGFATADGAYFPITVNMLGYVPLADSRMFSVLFFLRRCGFATTDGAGFPITVKEFGYGIVILRWSMPCFYLPPSRLLVVVSVFFAASFLFTAIPLGFISLRNLFLYFSFIYCFVTA